MINIKYDVFGANGEATFFFPFFFWRDLRTLCRICSAKQGVSKRVEVVGRGLCLIFEGLR
jgi:hypothetical protein